MLAFPQRALVLTLLSLLSFGISINMGEFKVHRVRFFDYMPSAIRTMAFNSRTERLALARADGAVEIFHFADRYFQEKVRILKTKKVISVSDLEAMAIRT